MIAEIITSEERKCKGMAKNELSVTEKAVRNAYMKAWRAKNRDKVKANNMRYWQRKAEKMFPSKEVQKNEYE